MWNNDPTGPQTKLLLKDYLWLDDYCSAEVLSPIGLGCNTVAPFEPQRVMYQPGLYLCCASSFQYFLNSAFSALM